MARIRTIKPEFPQSESMGRISRDARLLFILLWTLVDDSGRTRAASRMLASLLYPYDDDAPRLIDAWLEELEREECIDRYSVDGQSYLQIRNWLIHQKIDRPSKSKFPEFDESSRILANPREPSSLDQGRDQGKDQGKDPARASRKGEFLEDFEIVWGLYPKRPGASKADALKAYTARRKEGVTAEEIAEGVKRYAKYCAAEISEPKFIKQPETFFGPGRHFESDWNSSLNNSQPVIEEQLESAQTKIQFKWHDGKIRESTYQEIDDELERMGRARRWPQFTDPNYKASV